MLRKFVLVAAMALVDPGSTVQLMSAQLICFGYVLALVNMSPYKKDEADFTNQVANIQIMVSLLIAMALKTTLPAPGTPQSVIFDGVLTVSNGFVILVGSYSFFTCIKKRGKTMAKMASALRKRKKKEKEKKKQEAEETKEEETKTSPMMSRNKHAKVHPIMV